MEQTEQGRGGGRRSRYPGAWKNHLLETYPAGRVVTASAKASQMRAHSQLHSMRRDEQGRFNDLAGGVPDWTKGFADDLQDAVDVMILTGRTANTIPRLPLARSLVETIDPFAIEAAIAKLEVDRPDLWAILIYFQSPPGTRPWDIEEFAGQLELDRSALYKRRDWALYAVWERLPLAERLKAAGER